MISVDSLSFTYPPITPGGDSHPVLRDIAFEVPVGACVAVTGASGSGTTTLCMAVAGLAPRLTGGTIQGHITVAGHDVQAAPPGGLAGLLGVGLEDLSGQLFNPTVADEVAWGLENLGVPPADMPARIDRALSLVDLSNVPLDQPPQTLSGGQQRRLALAAALALEPRVLILDHPTGGLSPAARADLVRALHDLRAKQSLTILFAENDPTVIAALADQLIILKDGKIAAQGTPAEIYPLLDARQFPGISIPPAAIFAQTVNAGGKSGGIPLTCLTLDEAVTQVAGLKLKEPVPGSTEKVVPPGDVSDLAIRLDSLSYAYQPNRLILRDLALEIPRGQFITITGDNGAGKTTLARHLIGLLRPTSGRVIISGEDIARKRVSQIARKVGYAYQNPELQIFNPTVHDEIAFGLRNLGLSGDALESAVANAMDQFGLSDLSGYPPAMLSFSGRRLVALAGIAASRTPILVLDEPTVGLDAAGQARVDAWLANRHAAGATIVLITHDMEFAARRADRVVVMQSGRIAADGAPSDAFSQSDLLANAGLEPPFAIGFAARLARPDLAADLTPEGAARAWLERLA